MAQIAAILIRLLRLVVRELRGLQGIGGNNLLLLLFLLLQGGGRAAIAPLLVIGALLLTSMSGGALDKIPRERIALWPLSSARRSALRLLSIWLSPTAWILTALLATSAYRVLGVLLLALVVTAQAFGQVGSRLAERMPAINPLHAVPTLPGPVGQLIKKDLRQLLSYLDTYVAFALCAGATAYRFAHGAPDPAAADVVSVLAAVILGTPAQCLFGLDGPAGLTRYRLTPLRGWQILVAKDMAWLTALLVLVLPLSPLAGLSAGVVALAIGRHQAIHRPTPQTRWTLASGDLIPTGLAQSVVAVIAGMAVARTSAWYAAPCLLIYALSLWIYGLRWDTRQPGSSWTS